MWRNRLRFFWPPPLVPNFPSLEPAELQAWGYGAGWVHHLSSHLPGWPKKNWPRHLPHVKNRNRCCQGQLPKTPKRDNKKLKPKDSRPWRKSGGFLAPNDGDFESILEIQENSTSGNQSVHGCYAKIYFIHRFFLDKFTFLWGLLYKRSRYQPQSIHQLMVETYDGQILTGKWSKCYRNLEKAGATHLKRKLFGWSSARLSLFLPYQVTWPCVFELVLSTREAVSLTTPGGRLILARGSTHGHSERQMSHGDVSNGGPYLLILEK